MFKTLSPARFLFVVGFYFALIFAISVIGSIDNRTIDLSSKSMILMMQLLQTISVLILFIVPAVFFVLLFTDEKLGYLKLNTFSNFRFFILSVLLVVVALPLINYMEVINKAIHLPSFLSGLEQWMQQSEEKVKVIEEAFIANQTIADLFINLFVIALMAGLSEELFFRGLLQNAIAKYSKNIHVAIWVTAFLFSAFHMQFYGFIPRLFLGALLGYVYVWSGSLWMSIIVHFMNNALVVVYSYFIANSAALKASESVVIQNDRFIWYYALISLILTSTILTMLYRQRKLN